MINVFVKPVSVTRPSSVTEQDEGGLTIELFSELTWIGHFFYLKDLL